jgi:hypothetical protein
MFAVCVEPTSKKDFLEDDSVKDFINKQTERVLLHPDSEPYLTAGNGRITGLDPDKYYMIEEFNESGAPMGVRFVMENGMRSPNLGEINKVTDTVIYSLTNFFTYRVIAAAPLYTLSTNLSYFELVSDVLPAASNLNSAAVVNGEITILPFREQIYLNLAPAVNVNESYDITAIRLSPAPVSNLWDSDFRTSGHLTDGASAITNIADDDFTKHHTGKNIGIYQFRGSPAPAYLAGRSLLALEGEDTITEYIIAERNSSGNITKFNVLKVTVSNKTPQVYLHPDSENYLTAGNGRITGLDPDKYYMIEDILGSEFVNTIRYVRADGGRSIHLKDIGRATGGEVTGLTNFSTYKVRAAENVQNGTTLTITSPPAPSASVNVQNGTISLAAPTTPYFMNVNPIIAGTGWLAAMVPVSFTGNGEDVDLGSPIPLKGEGTIADYVFFTDSTEFKVLRVMIKRNLGVNLVSYTLPGLTNPIPNLTTIDINQNDLVGPGPVTMSISVNNATNFNTITWLFNNVEIGTGNTIHIDFKDDQGYDLLLPVGWNAPGTHIITIEAMAGTGTNVRLYSGTITVVVSPIIN